MREVDITINGESHIIYNHEMTEGGHLPWFDLVKRGVKLVDFSAFPGLNPGNSKAAIKFTCRGETHPLSYGRLYKGETLKIVDGMYIDVYPEKIYNEA